MNSPLKKFIKHEVQILLKENRRSELRTAYKREVFDNTNYEYVDTDTIMTALMHLFRLDGGPNDETRQMCIDIGPWWALQYAQIEGPHDDTRNAVLRDSLSSYEYAIYVDEGPRDDTRNAVLKIPFLSYEYAKYVDKEPRDDTRNAAWRYKSAGVEYDRYFGLNSK